MLKFISGNHKSKAAEATTLANKMIFRDKIQYIVGNVIVATCDAAKVVTEPNKVIFLFS